MKRQVRVGQYICDDTVKYAGGSQFDPQNKSITASYFLNFQLRPVDTGESDGTFSFDLQMPIDAVQSVLQCSSRESLLSKALVYRKPVIVLWRLYLI